MEYDPQLYKKIANYRVNEVVTVTNRKGRRKTIHITNITQLSWQELQLLADGGKNRFGKMVFLYEKYKKQKISSDANIDSVTKGEKLNLSETDEITRYVGIFRRNDFKIHAQVNNYISEHEMWDEFSTIRSLNDHCEHKNIPGILPKYFEIICSILKINGENGKPLTKATHY